MHTYGIECHDKRANEIKLFDEALANSCEMVQAIGIDLIDKFLAEKNEFTSKFAYAIRTMAQSTDDNFPKNRTHVDAISDNFAMAVDTTWYTLIELEASLHERIVDSMNMFSNTIRQIIENFNDKSNETFSAIRSACDAYFHLNANDASDGASKERHVSIINQKHDLMCATANKWLAKVIDDCEL